MNYQDCENEIIEVLRKYNFDYGTMIAILTKTEADLRSEVYLEKSNLDMKKLGEEIGKVIKENLGG